MEYIWKEENPKIKNSTFCCDCENGGLKVADIFSKFVSLQYSWIKRLFDNNFHQWKVIPLYPICQFLGKNNLDFILIWRWISRFYASFYKDIFTKWSKYLSLLTTLPSTVACQLIWYNKHIQTDIKIIYLYSLSNRDLSFIEQLFDSDGKLKSWKCIHPVSIPTNCTCYTTTKERNYKTFFLKFK